MTKIFELNKNLFKVGDNYICVEENPRVGDIGFIKIGISGTVGLISYDEKYHTWDLTTIDNIHYPFSSKKYLNKIVFSTQFIHESIPLLNLESEEDNVFKMASESILTSSGFVNTENEMDVAYSFFHNGYQKAKETFKYTEEDLFDAINFGNRQSTYILGHSKIVPEDSEEFIQSLQQPKLIKSIEVDYEKYDGTTPITENWKDKPIILPNGKIKCKINY